MGIVKLISSACTYTGVGCEVSATGLNAGTGAACAWLQPVR